MGRRKRTLDAMELTAHALESANSGDFEAMMRFYTADAVWDVTRWGLGIYHGSNAIRLFLEDWIGAFDRFLLEVERMVDFGNGVVCTVVVQNGWSAGGGGHVRLRDAPVFQWQSARAYSVTHYRDIAGAFSAAERASEAAA